MLGQLQFVGDHQLQGMSSLEYRPIFLIVFTVVVFFFSSTFVLAHAEWYDDSWEYRKKITLSLNTVISNDLTDFPVLISVTDPDLVQTNEALGRDIIFTTSDGTTKLFHEVERFDNTTGEIVAWVNFPTLSAASTTDIYMYYKGNTVGYNSADVWNDDYVVVWHLNQTSTGTNSEFKDATDNGNDGRGGGGNDVGHSMGRIPHLTNGQIGQGQELKGPTTTGNGQGSGDFIYRNSLNGMPARDFTIELWVGDIVNVPPGGNVALYNDMVSVCYDHNNPNGQWSNHINLWRAENVKMKIRTSFFVSTAAPGHPVQDDNPAAFTNWNHIVAVYNQKDADGTGGNSQLYINGVLVKDENRSGNLNRATQTDKLRLVLGGDIDSQGGNTCGRVNNELKGKVDEFRISSGLRTADYAAASYYNQGDPSTYLTLGGQETMATPEENSNNGSGCYNCTPPTMGYRDDDSFVRVVEDGFALNKVPFEVEHYAQSGTLVYTKTGAENHIQLKIYEDHGIENISTAIVFLALDEPDVYRNLVCLIWENTWDQKKSLTVLDKYGLVSETHGDFEIDGNQLILNYYFKKNFPIPESTIGVELRDHHKNMKRYYFENVFEVLGEPLIPTDGLIIQDNTVENFVKDTFENPIGSNNTNVHLVELYKKYSHELNIIPIIDTSKIGFSEKLTQKYLDRIDRTVEQNNLQLLQSKELVTDDSESDISPTDTPRVEPSLLESEELRALQVIDEITGRGVLMNSNGEIHSWDDNQTIFVPDWVKNNAKQWSEGLVSDEQFSKGLEFLLNENILNKNPNSKFDGYDFPTWLKQYAGFYGDGKISDTEFLDTISYLIESNIISIRPD